MGCFKENPGDTPSDRANKVLPIYKGGFYVDGGSSAIYSYCQTQAMINNKNAFSLWGTKDGNTCSIGDLDPSKLEKLDPSKCGPGWNPTTTSVFQINDITKNPGYKPPIYKGCFPLDQSQPFINSGVSGFSYSTKPEDKAKVAKYCETIARDKKSKYFSLIRNETACQFGNDDRMVPQKTNRTEATCGTFWSAPDARIYQVDYGNEKLKFPTPMATYL